MNVAASEIGAPPVASPTRTEAPSIPGTEPNNAASPEVTAGSNAGLPWLGLLLGTTAASWYLSALLHLIGYVAAAVVFVLFGHHLIELETEVTPIRASLDDFDRLEERPQFEAVAEISAGASSGDSDIQKLTNTLKAYENGIIDTVASEDLPSFLKSKDDDPDDGSTGFLFKLPESGLAVTKGSFTSWTEPQRPRPGQPYLIIIEVRLPENVKAYRISDLRGKVVGTDRYTQTIPYDKDARYSSFYTDESNKMQMIKGNEAITVRNNKVQLAIKFQAPNDSFVTRFKSVHGDFAKNKTLSWFSAGGNSPPLAARYGDVSVTGLPTSNIP